MTVLTAADAMYLDGVAVDAVYANGVRAWPPTLITLTVDHAKVAADLTDFPLYVDLSSMPDRFWRGVADGGGDIRCYAGSTELAREVVSCDTSARTGELHIRCDLSSTVDTTLSIDANGQRADYEPTDPHGSQAVWSDYAGVWHFSQEPSGAAPQILDSTANGSDGTALGSMAPGALVPGRVGLGLSFDGDNDMISLGSIDSANPLSLSGGEVTISAWMQVDPSSRTQFMRILDKSTGGSAAGGYSLWATRDDNLQFSINGNATLVTASASQWPSAGGSWVHVACVSGSSSSGLYVNGEAVKWATAKPIPATTAPLYFGGWNNGGNRCFRGALDEIRMAPVVRYAEWIAAEYANQSDPASFYEVTA